MRKALLSLAIVLVFGLPAYAQVSGGVKAGVNFANLKFDPEDEGEELDSRMGFIGGGYVTLPVGSVFAIQPEALYAQRGAKDEFEDVTATLKIDYIEFPILARLGTDSFNVFVGPSFNVKMNAEASVEGDETDIDREFDDEVKGSDVGLVLGVGFGGASFGIDVRVTWGLTDINDDPTTTAEVRNRSLAVMGVIRLK
jgi:hypothetical protein